MRSAPADLTTINRPNFDPGLSRRLDVLDAGIDGLANVITILQDVHRLIPNAGLGRAFMGSINAADDLRRERERLLGAIW